MLALVQRQVPTVQRERPRRRPSPVHQVASQHWEALAVATSAPLDQTARPDRHRARRCVQQGGTRLLAHRVRVVVWDSSPTSLGHRNVHFVQSELRVQPLELRRQRCARLVNIRRLLARQHAHCVRQGALAMLPACRCQVVLVHVCQLPDGSAVLVRLQATAQLAPSASTMMVPHQPHACFVQQGDTEIQPG